jgi:hypothetical protein
MKSLKFLAAATLLAGVLAQHAAAVTTHIYITGSSAFRSAAIAAIGSVTHLGNTSGTNGIVAGGGTGNDTTYTNATPPAGTATNGTQNTSFIWEGGFITNSDSSTTPVTVCATFTGSQAGCATCLGSLAIPFLPDGSTGTANKSAYLDAQGGLPNVTTTTYHDSGNNPHTGFYATTVEQIPDMAFSDVFQGTTPFNGSLALGTPFNTTATFASGNDNQVGFVTFKWLASKNFPLGTGSTGVSEGPVFGSGYRVSSISVEPNSLNILFTGGSIPLSQLTGSTTDQHTIIFPTGRNPDSGTRATALADSGVGVIATLLQYQPTSSSGAVTSHVLYPVETIAGLSTGTAGNSGEATGGTLRGYMALTLPATGLTGESGSTTAAYYVTYLGTGDAGNAAVLGIGTELSYKGVPFSITAIYQGQYTFWAIEHLYDRGDLTGAQAQTESNIVTALNNTATSGLSKAGISNLDATNNVFQAVRFGDGTQVFSTVTP